MTDSIQWYYYADAAPPAPPRAPCNDRTHAGAVFEGTPFSYHLKGDFSYQYSYMGIEKPRPPQGEQLDNKYTASDCLRETSSRRHHHRHHRHREDGEAEGGGHRSHRRHRSREPEGGGGESTHRSRSRDRKREG